jgi:sulfur-oxidizing protein SoxY
VGGGAAHAFDEQQPSSSAWELLRAKYYGDREMGLVDETFMSLDVPANTPDPAATPLTLHFADSEQRRVKRVRVFIDNNPSPLVATIDLAGAVPVTEIDLRVRIDRFTSVRAIAETADGSMEMRSSWVKASGGCSAPPSAAAGGTLGEIRFRPSADATSLQIGIRHPNSSGFQIDPRTGEPIPAHYISRIVVNAGGNLLFAADTGISLSENPTLRIVSGAPLPGPVTVDAADSETQAHYTATWNGAIRNGAAGSGVAGNGAAGSGVAGNGAAGNGTAGNGAAGNGVAGSGAASPGDDGVLANGRR